MAEALSNTSPLLYHHHIGAIARGIDDGLYVGAATVLRTAMDMAAHSFVLAHYHPSGAPTPTHEDEDMTLALRHLASGRTPLLNAHVIVTPSGHDAAIHEKATARRSAPPPARCAPAHPAESLQRSAPARISVRSGSRTTSWITRSQRPWLGSPNLGRITPPRGRPPSPLTTSGASTRG